jgi:integrase
MSLTIPKPNHNSTPTAATVAKLIAAGRPGKTRVAPGLYLQVTSRTSASWVYRYWLNGKAHYMGLGSAHAVPLARARELAAEPRRLRAERTDPLSHRRALQAAAAPKAVPLFEAYARTYIADPAGKLASATAKQRAQWLSSLERDAFPIIGKLPVSAIDRDGVLSVLRPIWNGKVASAMKLRGRLESILDAAKAERFREGENPARWRGNLDHSLAAPRKIAPPEHLAAMPCSKLPEFLKALRSREGVAARALEFLILTAARTGEAVGARWDEIDLDGRVWTIPKERMKAGRGHRVPLSDRALAILRELSDRRESAYVFPSYRAGRHLSVTSLLKILKSTKGGEAVTVHGFRSSFRNWCGENGVDRELAEMCLAHSIGNQTENSYKHTDLLERRRPVMNGWAAYLG